MPVLRQASRMPRRPQTDKLQPVSDALLRLVLAPDGRVVPDLAGNLPGKGIEIAASREALEQCHGALRDAFGNDFRLPDTLAAMIERGLVERVQSGIALARKSGQVVCGFTKVEQALRQEAAGLLLVAENAGSDAEKNLAKAQKSGIITTRLLSRTELGRPFGRTEVVHVWLQEGRLSAEILKEIRRLAGFRNKDTL